MKLCRFELHDDPGSVRSGIYHDGRFYETDGEKAAAIHEPGAVRLLAPVGTPPAIRLFEGYRAPDASGRLTYSFGHPGRIVAPNTEIDTSRSDGDVDFDVRIAALVQDGEPTNGPAEVTRMLLGVTIALVVFNSHERDELESYNVPTAPAADYATVLGPCLVTPEALTDNRTSEDVNAYTWPVKVCVNGDQVSSSIGAPDISLSELVVLASAKRPLVPGELLLWPALPKPALNQTPLGRFLAPSDKVSVVIEPIGALSFQII